MAGVGISQAGKGRASAGSHTGCGSGGAREAANTFSRDHPMGCHPHGPLVGRSCSGRWDVLLLSLLQQSLATPSFAYDHQEAVVGKKESWMCSHQGPMGPFLILPLVDKYAN